MAVVSDTSPLRYFVVTGYVELLRKVLGPIIIPELVWAELTHPSAPQSVRNFFASPTEWITVQNPTSESLLGDALDPGESAAISLALEIGATLLIDERRGRQEASRLGVAVTGGLGVLQEAHRRGFLPDPEAALLSFRQSGFRVSARLAAEFLRGTN